MGGEEEISWAKVYPPIPQITNNKIRRTHEPNVFTPFHAWMTSDDISIETRDGDSGEVTTQRLN
jgi:hypothetical protein